MVDDESMIVSVQKTALERFGYRVTGRTSSTEAIEKFRASPESFDLVITDQTMPHLSGLQLAKKILQIKPDMPIILCSGYSSLVNKGKINKIGIKKYAMKPLNIRELSMIVREVLDKG